MLRFVCAISPDFAVLKGRIPCAVRVGGDRGRIQVVGQDPLQGIGLADHSPHGNGRPAGEVELLRFLLRRADFEVVVLLIGGKKRRLRSASRSAGVVGGRVVDDPFDHCSP
jgi:hypothetical protein